MRYCFPKTQYYVSCRWITTGDGCRNFIQTPVLGKARHYAKRLKKKNRQIDVRVKGNFFKKDSSPYVLAKSWL